VANRRPLWIISLIVFVNLLGFGIIIPLLPFYADRLGMTPFAVGLLFAAYSVCQLLAAPVLGGLSDRYGRRPVLLFSLTGTVLSFSLLAVAQTPWMLFAARIIDGLSGGNISTARAYISDITEGKDRARAFGMIGAAFGLGFIFGPALGGLLGRYNYAAPAWAAAGLAGIALLLTFFLLPETAERKATAQVNWRELPRLLSRPGLRRLLLIDLLFWAAFSVYETTFALFAKERFGWGMTQVGYVLAFVGVIGVVVQGGLVRVFVARFGEKQVLLGGLLAAAIGLAAASFAQDERLFLLALVPAAIGAGLASPSLLAMISHAGQAGEQGRVQGVSSALESFGRIIGPVWGNGLLGWLGEGIAYLSAAAVLAVAAVAATRLEDSQTSQRSPES
jgi:multidrug resistance protein